MLRPAAQQEKVLLHPDLSHGGWGFLALCAARRAVGRVRSAVAVEANERADLTPEDPVAVLHHPLGTVDFLPAASLTGLVGA